MKNVFLLSYSLFMSAGLATVADTDGELIAGTRDQVNRIRRRVASRRAKLPQGDATGSPAGAWVR